MSKPREAPGQRFLKPAYMDRSYTSMHWFKDEPWTRPDQELPYEHQNERIHLCNIAGSDAHCIPDPAKPTAQEQTQLWAYEVQDAWKAAQSLIASGFNVNIITGLLPCFLESQLRDIVKLSWERMFKDARSRLASTPENGYAVDYDTYYNQSAQLPGVRNIDVREYFRLYYMSGEFTVSGRADEHAENYDVEVWNTLYKANRLPDSKDSPRFFMFPFLNYQDLSNPEILRCLILNRLTNHPRNFARADWEGCHLGFASKICQSDQCDNWFMGFPTEEERNIYSDADQSGCYGDYPVVFKEPNKQDTESGLFDRLRKTGRIFSWGEGKTVLAVQALTLRLVVAIATQLENELNRRRQEGLDLNGKSISIHEKIMKDHTWQNIPSRMLTFDVGKTDLVACHQFFPPAAAISWDEEFTKILKGRLDGAEKFVFNLWHDPFFFQSCITSQYFQHYGHVPEDGTSGHRNALPHITNSDIDAKKALVNDLIRRVVRWAAFNLEMWKCLVEKLAALRQMAQDFGIRLDKWNPLLSQPGPIRDAWIDLGFHARWFAERHAIHAADHGGLLASESLKSHFQRISPWDAMKIPVPGDEWVLPRQFYTKIGMAVRGSHNDAVDIKDHEHIEDSADQVAMSALIMHIGLRSEHTIGCIGLHKLIQAMRYNRQQTHSDLGVPRMASEDYDNMFWTGLLSLRMEAIRPYGDAIAKSTFRVNKQHVSDIGAFFTDYDRFPFENHVDENTLRLVHWSLGIAYSPLPAVDPSRPSGLVQGWLQNFWEQITNWLRSESDQSRFLRGHSYQDNGVSMEAQDDQADAAAKQDAQWMAYVDSCLTAITEVLREFVNDQDLDDTDVNRNFTALQRNAYNFLRRYLDKYNIDGLSNFDLRTPMSVAPKAIWGLLLQQGVARDEVVNEETHLKQFFFSFKAFRILLNERDTLQIQWYKKDDNQDGRPLLIRRPRAQRVRKKLSKKRKGRDKARMIKSRPKEFLEYLESLNRNEYRPDRDTFDVMRICGRISTMLPPGQMDFEPTEEYRPPPDFDNRLRVQAALVNRSHTQKTLELYHHQQQFWRDVREIQQELRSEGRRELRGQDWETADIILGDSQGEVNYKTYMAFCLRLGFDFKNREGSKVAMCWTEACRFKRPASVTTLVFHIRHPGGVTRRLDNDIKGSCRRTFRDDYGLTLELVERLYERYGPS